ncbi:MAG: N-acetylneuraminate synthase family protein [Actinobacteria bacterium]|jgi:N-acetylneuraminate synthase (EC 2.5.1.56)|nr:N-acetylneuraminate synthase family protein [Actinomycetota bacterium]
MIIERTLAPLVVYGEDPVLRALEKITANKARIVFVVSEHGHLIGALSDGDFRRWVATQSPVDLTRPAREAANTAARTVPATSSPAEIRGQFSASIDHLPLVDGSGHLVAVAINRSDSLRIGRHDVGAGKPSLLIAEIGINHNGSVDLAKHLVDLAKKSNADVVKFQLRDLDALYRGAGASSAGEDLGPQYTLDLLSRFNLTGPQLFEVFDHCRAIDIDVMCTPWDAPSVDALVEYGIPALKIASADLTNHDLLRHAARSGTPMILSTGMSTEGEILETVDLLKASGTAYALLHCQSTYPAPFKDVNLRYLTRLAELGDCPVGYSGHERGFHVPIAAIGMGATIIEKHFTVDRGMEGNDHKVSLLPDEFAEMVARIREVEEALGTDAARAISTGEMMNRVNLAKSLVAAADITEGETITADKVDIKSPGRGLQPNALTRLVGRRANRSLAAGDFFYATDLSDAVARGRNYTFRRPWGLPVRYHDIAAMTEHSTPDFLEFHFSYKDLEIDPATIFTERSTMGYACHAPDLFTGDFILNMASEDDAHWQRSIEELQRVIELTKSLRQWFTTDVDPVVISSLGGFTKDRHVPADELPDMYARVEAGLKQVDDSGVRLCAQTLPPFPWYMGGQLFCNLFVGAADTAAWAAENGRRLCLDVSHSKLAANFNGAPFSGYVDLLAPHADHLHLVDATGVDGEGVQVGDGEVDWALLAQQLDQHAPGVSFIPEIWQGHVNNGEGFWVALERLEQWF